MTEITDSSGHRPLQPWQEEGEGDELLGDLEELVPPQARELCQFQTNHNLTGYESTFLDDLSQYSTKLDKSSVPKELRWRAEVLAREIEGSAMESQPAPGSNSSGGGLLALLRGGAPTSGQGPELPEMPSLPPAAQELGA